ncbi:MAG: CRTAC1 family protein [Planctomycetaceae bacterium]
MKPLSEDTAGSDILGATRTSLWQITLLLLLASVLAGCKEESNTAPTLGDKVSASPIAFENATEAMAVDSVYQNGREAGLYAIVESLGGGVGIVDIDADDWPDIVFPGGGILTATPNASIHGLPLNCWRNERGGKMRDVTGPAAMDLSRRYSHGISAADFNNDGFQDFLVTGFGGVDLWMNTGDGTFLLQTSNNGLRDTAWSSSAGWGDLDRDGSLDLYIAHYTDWSLENNPDCPSASVEHEKDVCPPRRFDGLNDVVYQSQANDLFADTTEAWGLKPEGKGLGVLLADFDSDRDLDVYVANDTTNNFLYLNDGDGHLQESGLLSGGAVDSEGRPNGSMGLDFFDFDHDQKGDLWVTNFEQESFGLYHNVGHGNFLHVSRNTGITSLGGLFVGFGTVARDFDSDGDHDIAVANGHVIYYPNKAPFAQQSVLLENINHTSFQRVTTSDNSFFSKAYVSRGLAAADLDRDGRMDLVFSQLNQPAQILLNKTPVARKPIRIRLRGRRCNRDAIGAHVTLKTSRETQSTYIIGGGSYLSTSEMECEFSVPADDTDLVAEIQWPDGTKQQTQPSTADTSIIVVQGQPIQYLIPH